MNNVKHLHRWSTDGMREEDFEFAEIGEDIIESESLTNKVYETFVALIAKGWRASSSITTKKEFTLSDIGAVYKIGPYIPCVKRVAYTRSIDLTVDGLPGVRVAANTQPGELCVDLIRPCKPPREICFLDRTIRKYKHVGFFPGDNGELEALVLYFGVTKDGSISSPLDKRREQSRAWFLHGAQQLYPALAMNAWADSRYLWIANTSEDIGYGQQHPLRLRLGLSKEHIKSLFYARSLPVTETGRKRPILHWVRAHQRRIKEGIDVDVRQHLRGIIEFEMDGLGFQITQPNKTELQKAEPETVAEAFRVYA